MKSPGYYDEAWVREHDALLERARADLSRVIALLTFNSNANFVEARGRVVMAMQILESLDKACERAQAPF